MSDVISRQVAIDDIETVNPSMPLSVNWVKNWVKTLPSAQPVDKDINVPTNDTISRQAAIDALIEWYGCEPNDIDVFKEIIYNKLSAQPEIVRCKECKHAPKCYGNVLMRSRGGGYIYCPVEYCSAAERRTDGKD